LLDPGSRFGRYEIVAPLGAGGMGQVYRARDTRLEREVALKVLPDDVARDPSRLRRFEQEARAVAALNHPNIVAMYDVGEGYLVTELVDGEPIGGNAGRARALDISAQIADGLAAAHEACIVHRDLKPANVLLRRDGRVKILDFGLAKVDGRAAAEAASSTVTMQTQPGIVMGTAGYMSPEQVRGRELDARSDIFNIGLILYELLTGERAFRADSGVEVMAAILNQEPAPLPETLPLAVRRVVSRCLEKKPEDRFQSAADLAFSLRECMDVDRPPVVVRRRSWTLPAAILAAVAIGVAAGLVFRRPPQPPVSWTQLRMGGPEVAWRPRL
jgi:serine/threonine protein kinase